jgi:thiamine-phosphate pyrophosphorylase
VRPVPIFGVPLYPIVDTAVCATRGLDPLSVARAYVEGGARVVQLRAKMDAGARFLALADGIIAVAAPHGARVIINDRADIALMAGAAGVHVGQDDLPPADVRALVGSALTIGLSTHDAEQIARAVESPADYIAVGPIHSTSTKDTGYAARGLDLVRMAAGRGKPVVGIGGITLENAAGVLAAGASAVSIISDLLAGDPRERTRAFLARHV